MSCNLETPKSWGAAQQPVGRHPVMSAQVVGSQGNDRASTAGRAAPSHSTSDDGTGSRSEGRRPAKGPGRISNRRKQKGNGIERIMHFYLLETKDS